MFWPENKVISLMEIVFHFGAINYELNNGKKIREMWKEFKANAIDKKLKYINPDPRCTHPVNLDVIDYCWGYAEKIDKGEEIDMNELCEGCEFFREEVKNENPTQSN
jgi:hypothetical protein